MAKYSVEFKGRSADYESAEAARRAFYALMRFHKPEEDGPLVQYASNASGARVLLEARGMSDEDKAKWS